MKPRNISKICLAALFVASLLVISMMAFTSAIPSAVNVESAVKTRVASEVTKTVQTRPNLEIVNAPPSTNVPGEVQTLKEQLPTTFEATEARILPLRGRYLMYTNDLKHIMWGQFGGQYFTGVDNLGKRAWGIYGRGYFAGFYDGQFFWGKYGNGYWNGFGLFGLNVAHGRYLTYPLMPVVTSASSISP